MFLNIDQLENQLEKEEFHEIRSMAAFRVLKTQFQQFIDSRFSSDYDGQMTSKCFLQYTRIEMQTKQGNVDTSKALDASLVVTKSRGMESEKQDTSSRSGNDIDTDDANIRPSYDEEPMAKFASQVVEKKYLTKPITPHFLPQVREYAFAKLHHVIASGSSKYSSPTVSNKTSKESYGSNDMIHNHYLDDARKKAQALKDINLISKPSVMPSARSQNTSNGLVLQRQMTFDYNSSNPAPQRQQASDYENSGLAPQLQEFSPPADKTYTSLQELELLFKPIIPPTNVNAEENNTDQVADAQFKAYEFINAFAPSGTEAAESSSRNADTLKCIHSTKDNILTTIGLNIIR
ncbi:hypothetical protein Tco_0971490 [Tanacetum coccineum]